MNNYSVLKSEDRFFKRHLSASARDRGKGPEKFFIDLFHRMW
ncbi:hypothetical protein CLOM621_07597 [Clostridium sp. M62/1]|nr:hypothetical protein CLOM621_07597 [Clostridium sp. M62/1]